MSRLKRIVRGERAESGMSLVELLVGSMLFLMLSGLVLGSAVTTAKAAKSSREVNDLNEEARVLINRMSRELREAKKIVAVENPTGTGYDPSAGTLITFWVDFNGDGEGDDLTDPVAAGADPELITYEYVPGVASGRVYLRVPGNQVPVLAGQVTKFALTFTSSKYLYDGQLDGVQDGKVTWEELDGYPSGTAVGDGDGELDAELDSIDAVKIDLTVFQEPRRQNYQTQIALRNKT